MEHSEWEWEDIDWESVLLHLPSPEIRIHDILPDLQITWDDSTHQEDYKESEENPAISPQATPDDCFASQLNSLTDLLLHDQHDHLQQEQAEEMTVYRDDEEENVIIKSFFADVFPYEQQQSDGNVPAACRPHTPSVNSHDQQTDGLVTSKRKRNRDSAFKSRERKKEYVAGLESKLRTLKRNCRNLENALTFASLENATLKQEITRFNGKVEDACKPEGGFHRNHDGKAESAALSLDSLQKESMFCLVMLMFLLAIELYPSAPRRNISVALIAVSVSLKGKERKRSEERKGTNDFQYNHWHGQ
eukprot:Gb_00122 [translate_table: standard]